MIVAAVCVPQTPLLLPGITGTPVPEVEGVHTTALEALGACRADEWVIVGAAPRTGVYSADAPSPVGHLAPTPGRRPAVDALPVALVVGRALLEEAALTAGELLGVSPGESPDACAELGRRLADRRGRTALLIAADGSARRGEKAPGHLDQRAFDLDERISQALAVADPSALLALDPEVCDDLLVAGRPALQVLAGACAGRVWTARMHYADDPFGVAYWVTTWTLDHVNH